MRAAAPGVVSRVKPATRSLIQRFSCGALAPMVVLSLMASRGGRLIARSSLDELNLPSPRTPATLSRHCEGPKGARQSRAAAWWLWIATSAAPPRNDGCGVWTPPRAGTGLLNLPAAPGRPWRPGRPGVRNRRPPRGDAPFPRRPLRGHRHRPRAPRGATRRDSCRCRAAWRAWRRGRSPSRSARRAPAWRCGDPPSPPPGPACRASGESSPRPSVGSRKGVAGLAICGRDLGGVGEEVPQLSQAGVAVDVVELQEGGSGARLLLQGRVLDLRQVDEGRVVAEVVRQQLRMAIERQALDDQALEMAGQVVGQVEASGVALGQLGEGRLAAVEGVAVGAGKAAHPLLLQHPVEQAAGAAVPIGDEDPLYATGPGGADLGPHPLWDLLGAIVPDGRQAGDLQLAPAVEAQALDDLAAQRTAGDDQAGRRALRL